MSDLITATRYEESLDLSFEFRYRLNFMEDKSCGYSKVYKGKLSEDEENFELYMELYECGLSKEEALKRFEKLIVDTKEGKLDF